MSSNGEKEEGGIQKKEQNRTEKMKMRKKETKLRQQPVGKPTA